MTIGFRCLYVIEHSFVFHKTKLSRLYISASTRSSELMLYSVDTADLI